MPDRVVVLGASGFIGRAVVEEMSSSGCQAVCPERRESPAADKDTEWWNPSEGETLSRVIRASKIVIDVAGGTPHEQTYRARVLAEASLANPSPVIVTVSSASVFDGLSGRVIETTRPAPLTSYARNKLKSEAVILRAGQGNVVLRVGCVYGRGSPRWIVALARLLQRGQLGDIEGGDRTFMSLIHVRELARAIVKFACRAFAPGGLYHLTAPYRLTWHDYAALLAEGLGLASMPRVSRSRLLAQTRCLAPIQHMKARLGMSHAAHVTPSLRRALLPRIAFESERPAILAPSEFLDPVPEIVGAGKAARMVLS